MIPLRRGGEASLSLSKFGVRSHNKSAVELNLDFNSSISHTSFPFSFGWGGAHLGVLKAYLGRLREPYGELGIEPDSAAIKASDPPLNYPSKSLVFHFYVR